MYVSKLVISGVRGFHGPREVRLDFRRPDGSYKGWTVLAGRNGSGKTTVLQAIALGLVGEYFVRDLESWGGNREAENSLIRVTVVQDPEFDGGFDFGPEDFEVRWSAEGEPFPPPRWSGSRNIGPRSPRLGSREGWFFAGYGPFRRLSSSALGRGDSRNSAKYAGLRTLFDEDVSLVEGVSWLVEQHLYQLEERAGAAELLDGVLRILGDGMLPDGYAIARVDSEGLWLRRGSEEFPLRRMSDGYRAVTALVVDIIRQMHLAYGRLELSYVDDIPCLAYPGVVLVDEIENHLHVSWQKKIGDWLKNHFPLVQFIVTTHSPYVCQTADLNGLVALPGPDESRPARTVDQDLYERIVYGSGDDAILTELFGVDSPYSTRAERIRRQLGELEEKVLSGAATEDEARRYKDLSDMLTSSLAARVDEVSSRFRSDT